MRPLPAGIAFCFACLLAAPAGATGPFMVFFDSGSEQPNQYGDAILDNAILWLRDSRVTRLRLVGSADRVGSAEYNLRLSQRRAGAVKAALVKRGFPADAIEVQGRGEHFPLVETPDGVPERQNRYVLFEIVVFDGIVVGEGP